MHAWATFNDRDDCSDGAGSITLIVFWQMANNVFLGSVDGESRSSDCGGLGFNRAKAR